MKEKPKEKKKIVHVFPVNEIEEHEKTENCKCKPTVQEFGSAGKLYLHNSFAGTKYFDIDVKDNKWSKQDFLHI